MESMTVEQMLGAFKTLCGASGYYKANIVVSVNGKVMPVKSVAMNAVMGVDDTYPSYTFCLSVKENKEDYAHVFTQDAETNRLSEAELMLRLRSLALNQSQQHGHDSGHS